MLYLFNIILNYNQGLALFRQKQVLRSNSHKYLQKQNNEDFFIRLLNAWLHFTNSSFPAPTIVKKILDQPIFLNPQTKLRTYFLQPSIPPRNISDKFTIVYQGPLYNCRCSQPFLISSTTFGDKLDFTTGNHKRICKFIKYLIPNDWKHLLKTETP